MLDYIVNYTQILLSNIENKGSMSNSSAKLAAVPDVDIDSSGRFKYVLIKCHIGDEEKFIVRGYKWAGFHADVYDQVWERLEGLGIETECMGGGRITHDPEKKQIKIFGYSQGFGLADHAKSAELIKKQYPDYSDITWSNEGY